MKVISGPQVKQSGSTKPLFHCGSCTSVLLSWQFFPLKKVKAKHPIEDLGKGRNCKSDVGTGPMSLVINPDVNVIAAIAIMSHLIMTISVFNVHVIAQTAHEPNGINFVHVNCLNTIHK